MLSEQASATTNTDSVLSRDFNLTAYRIFKILEMLYYGPKTLEQINQLLLQDPRLPKTISLDTLNLCLNTLRMIGCEIQRPSTRTQWHYVLLKNAYALSFSRKDKDLMYQVYSATRPYVTEDEKEQWDKILHCFRNDLTHPENVLMNRALQDKPLNHWMPPAHEGWDTEKENSARFQRLLRSALKKAGRAEDVVIIYYDALGDGYLSAYCVSPTNFHQANGRSYMSGPALNVLKHAGHSHLLKVPEDLETATQQRTFRLDRVTNIELAQEMFDAEQYEALLVTLTQERKKKMAWVKLYLYTDEPIDNIMNMGESVRFVPFQDDPEHYETLCLTEEPYFSELSGYWEVMVCLKDVFFIKQKLMFIGLPFNIVEPVTLRQEMALMVGKMLSHYQTADELDLTVNA
ncbi:MAG: hypothetical protein ACKO37_07330 [Vampirovibrionales bacterium]